MGGKMATLNALNIHKGGQGTGASAKESADAIHEKIEEGPSLMRCKAKGRVGSSAAKVGSMCRAGPHAGARGGIPRLGDNVREREGGNMRSLETGGRRARGGNVFW